MIIIILSSLFREHEDGIASNHGSACHGNMYPGPVHTARHTLENSFAWNIRTMIIHDFCVTLVTQCTFDDLIGTYHGGDFDWGEVVTR
jgi:hypothetical protein